MLRIRLSRGGKKKQPYYRVVVADVDAKRDGRIVERIGHYNPLAQPEAFTISEDRALHWLNVGAQPSDAVRRLLEKQGTYDRLERLRAGESADALVAEFEGRPVESAEEEAAPEPVVLESSEPTAHPEAIVAESETEAEGTEEPEEAGAAEEAEAPEPVVFESSEPTAQVDEDAETEEEETEAEAPEPVVMESSEPTAQVDEAESDEEETSGESSDEDEEEGAA